MDSILTSVKQMLGIDEKDTNFDAELIMHINSVFTVLHQLGVGPDNAYSITSAEEKWEKFVEEQTDIELVKSYIYLKVRLIFDPPQNSFLVKAIESQLEQFEWRLQVQAEPYTLIAEAEEEEE